MTDRSDSGTARPAPNSSEGGGRVRASLGRVLLPGVALAGLLTAAAGRTWVDGSGDATGVEAHVALTGTDLAPLTLALALVCLAGWGVVLVGGARLRRLIGVLGVVAALGALVAAALTDLHSSAASALADRGVTGPVQVARSGWYFAALLAAFAEAVLFGLVLRRGAGWATMGERYQAPQAGPAAEGDLWRALDEGRDPTAPGSP